MTMGDRIKPGAVQARSKPAGTPASTTDHPGPAVDRKAEQLSGDVQTNGSDGASVGSDGERLTSR